MKAWKIVIFVLVAVVLVAGLGSWWLSQNVDRIAQEALTDVGHELADTKVSVESVDISLASGKATIRGLSVANPPGYSQRPLLLLDTIEVDIALDSIGDDVLVIEQILVKDSQVSYELDGQGVSNVSILEKNVGKTTPGSSGGENRLIIEHADFKGGTITAIAAQQPGKELVFDFPSVSFTGLGAPDGASPDQLGNEISTVLIDRILDAAKRAGVESLLEKQKERALEKVRDLLKEKVDEIKGEDG